MLYELFEGLSCSNLYDENIQVCAKRQVARGSAGERLSAPLRCCHLGTEVTVLGLAMPHDTAPLRASLSNIPYPMIPMP